MVQEIEENICLWVVLVRVILIFQFSVIALFVCVWMMLSAHCFHVWLLLVNCFLIGCSSSIFPSLVYMFIWVLLGVSFFFFQALPLFIDLFTTSLKTVHSKRRRMFTCFSDCLCDIYLLFSTHGRGFWFVRRRHLLFISQYCMFIPTNDMLHICLISYCILLTVHSSSSSLFWLHVPWRINLTLLHI